MNDILNKIVEIIELTENVTLKQLRSKTKDRKIVECRAAYSILGKSLTDKTYREIGEFINRNHCSIIHYHKKLNDIKEIKRIIKRIENNLPEEMKPKVKEEVIPPPDRLDLIESKIKAIEEMFENVFNKTL